MDKQLLNYKSLVGTRYLDGRYFNLVFQNQPGLIRTPMVIQITKSETKITSGDIIVPIGTNVEYYIIRLIIEIVEKNKVVSRHSNVVIIDNVVKKVIRFEPFELFDAVDINKLLSQSFSSSLGGYFFVESSAHPQRLDGHNGLCVAYVIKFALFYISKEPIVFEGTFDILNFSDAVMTLLGPLSVEGQDIEFGFGGFGVGLLGGALIGGLIAAPLVAAAAAPRYYPAPRYYYV
jgi:hypothetical protein